ncbi:Glutathione S-transferase P [Phlyctochytrium bullatum]|nr:Glutathione S-transferase P [Phlyctochytrium bullatum]
MKTAACRGQWGHGDGVKDTLYSIKDTLLADAHNQVKLPSVQAKKMVAVDSTSITTIPGKAEVPTPQGTSFKLIYFKVRGLSERTRLILSAGKAAWTESHVSDDWHNPDPSLSVPAREASGANEFFGQVPILVEYQDGEEVFRMTQSKAIERFAAKKVGLCGGGEGISSAQAAREEAWLDMLWESWAGDFVQAIRKAMADNKGDDAGFNKAHRELLLKQLETQEKFLKVNRAKGPFYLGDRLSYLDTNVFTMLERSEEQDQEAYDEAIQKFPAFAALAEAVKVHPGIKEFINGGGRWPAAGGKKKVEKPAEEAPAADTAQAAAEVKAQ